MIMSMASLAGLLECRVPSGGGDDRQPAEPSPRERLADLADVTGPERVTAALLRQREFEDAGVVDRARCLERER
jgi:hypothetical protein